MAEKSTFIKIDRNIINWGWYKNPKILSVFIWLIVRANTKKKRFEKDDIERGSLATSNAHIAEECGITIDNVRTALSNLESTGEIIRERRPKYQIITIVNYDAYQSGITKSPYQIPIKSQSNPDQIPTTNEYKNIRIKEKEKSKKESPSPHSLVGSGDVPKASMLKPIDEGTVDDIPEDYRDFCHTYADYWRFRNR